MSKLEQLVLDGLSLNDGLFFRLQGFECPPPKKRYEWAQGGDADGSALVRDPLHENREITLRIRVMPMSTMDLAMSKVALLIDKFEEAERQPNGLNLVWTPADGTQSITFKVLSGEITGLPITMDGEDAGWFLRAPVVTMMLTCKPFGYGTEVVGTPAVSVLPTGLALVANVPGDVPAEGRLIVTDSASQARRYVEWGLEQRYYNAATSNIVDSDNMVTSGFGGVGTTRSGAYDPNATGNSVIRATLWRSYSAVCGTGNLSHVGTFRVRARLYGSGTGMIRARLAWQEGDGPFRSNEAAALHVINGFCDVDLGIISIPEKEAGTQRWSGRIEAYSDTAGDTLDVDYLILMPAGEGYGRARATGSPASLAAVAFDNFESLTPGTVLNARTALSGGSWATSGAATDFAGYTTQGLVARSTGIEVTPRWAILGTTNYTDTQAEIWAQYLSSSFGPAQVAGVITRWVDSSNHLYARLMASSVWQTQGFEIWQVVAGTSTRLANASLYFSPNTWWGIKLIAYATGSVLAEVRTGDASTPPLLTLKATSTAVATAGALATGKPGFFDHNQSSVANTRLYDFFSASTPASEPVVINSTRAMEVRSDTTIRADSTNTYWGPVPAYRGSRFLIPPAGDDGRTSRVVVKAHRQDIELADAANVTDSLTVQVNYTPRYLAIPR